MRSARPTCCYYEALGVEKTASQQEIVATYRNLARIHHPDKNPNDENATARFQRIQAAHETRSDESKRAYYDRITSDCGTRYFYDEDDEDFGGPRFAPAGYEDFIREQVLRRAAEMSLVERERRGKMLADRRRREKVSAEKARKEKEEKDCQERLKKEADELKMERDRKEQEQRWKALFPEGHVLSESEKQKTCLHSSFSTKIYYKKKCKCGACGQKSGMTLFKCPHCALESCQLCLTKFNKKNDKA